MAGKAAHKGVKRYTYGDRTMTLAEWAEQDDIKALGLSLDSLRGRLDRMWTFERAVTEPKVINSSKTSRFGGIVLKDPKWPTGE